MRPTEKKGFTLIEMAIVLVILGLVMSTVVPLITALVKNRRAHADRKAVTRAVEEIKGFLQLNRRLPTRQEFKNTFANNRDSHDKTLYYFADADLADDICRYYPLQKKRPANQITRLTLEHHGNVSNTDELTGAVLHNQAFIIGSGGANMNRQFRHAEGGGIVSVTTYAPGARIDTFADGEDPNAKAPYDDIVVGVNANEIIGLNINCSLTVYNKTGESITVNGDETADGAVKTVRPNEDLIVSTSSHSLTTSYEDLLTTDADNENRLEISNISTLKPGKYTP